MNNETLIKELKKAEEEYKEIRKYSFGEILAMVIILSLFILLIIYLLVQIAVMTVTKTMEDFPRFIHAITPVLGILSVDFIIAWKIHSMQNRDDK